MTDTPTLGPTSVGSQESHTVTVLGPVPVLIQIARDVSGVPIGLFLASEPQAQPMIWWAPEGSRVKPWHPETLAWFADELRDGEEILIAPEPQPLQQQYFKSATFTLSHQLPFAATGPVLRVASGEAKAELWIYRVRLTSTHLHIPLTIDPIIIIVREH